MKERSKIILKVVTQSLVGQFRETVLYGSEWTVYRLTHVINLIYANAVGLFGWYYLAKLHFNPADYILLFIPVVIICTIIYCLSAYALFNKKINFLKTFQYLFNMIVQFIGFLGCCLFFEAQWGYSLEQSFMILLVIPITNIVGRFMSSWRKAVY